MKKDTIIAIIIAVLLFTIPLILNPIQKKENICINITITTQLPDKQINHLETWCSNKLSNLKNYNNYLLNINYANIQKWFYKKETGKEFNAEEFYHISAFETSSNLSISESSRLFLSLLSANPKEESKSE